MPGQVLDVAQAQSMQSSLVSIGSLRLSGFLVLDPSSMQKDCPLVLFEGFK